MGKVKGIIKGGTKLITFGSVTATLSAASAYVVPTVAIVNPVAGAIVGGAIAIASTIVAGAVCDSCVDPYVDKVIDSFDDTIKQTKEEIDNNTEDIKIAKEFEKIMNSYPYKSSEGECDGREYLSSKGYSEEDQDKLVAAYNREREKKESKNKKKGSRG